MQETVVSQNAGTDITTRLSQDDLREGWAELGRTPRVLATLKMGAKTDLGRVRENNEDKFDFFEPEDLAVLASKGAFYAVADGMGGHSAGQIACEMALKTAIQTFYGNPTSDIEASLRLAVQEANSLVYDTAQSITDRQGMGTTLTAAVIHEDQLTIAQVGDSRAYLLRDGSLTQITQDHSWVAEQVRLGVMTADEAQTSPFRNIITRSVGTAATVEADIATRPLQAGDTVLLCSDGLTGHLDVSDIEAMLLEHAPSVAAMHLVEEANRRGGRDNITVLILSVRGLAPYEGTSGAAPEPDGASDSEASAAAKPEKRGWARRK
ncbi:MAG: Stp1/IreP family PP2C-type Ser/Thr phosphatase [Armatimonadota bacterium]|nr:Stp1/IreP family PP2C-type Ser/Thr phosphatase [Armatimonadota bacterium]